jgi:hypothetical protein
MPAAEAVLVAIRSIAAGIRTDVARSIPQQNWDFLIETLKSARANLSELRAANDKASDAV